MKTNTRQRGKWQRAHSTSIWPIAKQNFPQYYEVYIKFFNVFQKFYLFISRYFAQSLIMFCGTLIK